MTIYTFTPNGLFGVPDFIEPFPTPAASLNLSPAITSAAAPVAGGVLNNRLSCEEINFLSLPINFFLIS